MARKRKAPPSEQLQEQKPKIVRAEEEDKTSEEVEEVEEEEEEEEESSSEEESSAESEEEEEEEEGDDGETSSSEEEESDEASKRATVRELLEPFGKDQIVDILKEAASKDSELLSKIIQLAESDETNRKIFVHGLGWDATSEQLVQAFRPFGEIEESKLITDKNTGRAKGYAFVLFKTRAAAKKALKVPLKKIGSRNVSCQLAALGPITATQASDVGRCKIYVGNVGPNVNPEKLKAFFRTFGEIEDGPIGIDASTNQFRGFAVITYKSAEGYNKALEQPIKMFENARLNCKKFVENHADKNNAALQTSVSTATGVSDNAYGGMGVNPGILSSNLNLAGYLMAQNTGLGLAGNAMLPSGYSPAGLMPSGLSSSFAGMGGNYGMGSSTPSVMGRYGSQAALQGLESLQSSQMGLSSVGTTTTIATSARDPESVGKETAFPSYFRL